MSNEPNIKSLEEDVRLVVTSNREESENSELVSGKMAKAFNARELSAKDIKNIFVNGILGSQTPPTVDTPE